VSAPIPAAWRIGVTPSGLPITCDGCRRATGPVTEAMVHPVRHPERWDNGAGQPCGPGDVHFIVCPPQPDGSNPCLVVAELEESLDTPAGPDCGCRACRIGLGRHR
jgi:hypothetical protein